MKFKFAKSNQNWFHRNDMFKHVLGIIDLKKTKEWQKKYTHSIISFHFLLYSWRIEDLMIVMIDLNFKSFYGLGPIFCILIRYSWIPLQKAHRLQYDAQVFPFFSISMAPWKWSEKRCDWFCNHVTYWIHWTKRQVWTHWRRYWYYNDLKK